MKVIKEDGCTAFGKVYHKECFKCCVCKRRIDGKFFQKNGKPYCEKDYAVSNHNFHKIIYVPTYSEKAITIWSIFHPFFTLLRSVRL